MSTLSFLPYITEHFSKEYIIPNYFGESLSSLIPGVLAMAQSFHRPEKPCKNVFNTSINGTETALINSNSTLSNRSTSHYLYNANYSVSLYFGLLFVLILSSIISFTWLNYSNVAIKSRKKKESRVKYHDSLLEMSNLDDRNEQHHQELDVNIHISKKKDINEKMILISLAFITCFINYGYLPGLYSVNFFF
jgi:hypothetical protein